MNVKNLERGREIYFNIGENFTSYYLFDTRNIHKTDLNSKMERKIMKIFSNIKTLKIYTYNDQQQKFKNQLKSIQKTYKIIKNKQQLTNT